MIEKLGGRKFTAGLMTIIVGVAMVIVKGDIPPNLLQLLEVVFGGVALGNVASQAVYSFTKNEAPKISEDAPPPTPDHAPALENISNGVVTIQKILEFIIQRTGLNQPPK